MKYKKCEKTCQIMDIVPNTLHIWAKQGKIKLLENPGDSEHIYDISAMTGEPIPARGYLKAGDLVGITGLSYSKIEYWSAKGLIPSFFGSGNRYYNMDRIDLGKVKSMMNGSMGVDNVTSKGTGQNHD